MCDKLYSSYKKNCNSVWNDTCEDVFKIDISSMTMAEINKYLLVLQKNIKNYSKKYKLQKLCYLQRERFRDKCIPEEKRDLAHEWPIKHFKKQSNTCLQQIDRVWEIIHELQNRALQLEKILEIDQVEEKIDYENDTEDDTEKHTFNEDINYIKDEVLIQELTDEQRGWTKKFEFIIYVSLLYKYMVFIKIRPLILQINIEQSLLVVASFIYINRLYFNGDRLNFEDILNIDIHEIFDIITFFYTILSSYEINDIIIPALRISLNEFYNSCFFRNYIVLFTSDISSFLVIQRASSNKTVNLNILLGITKIANRRATRDIKKISLLYQNLKREELDLNFKLAADKIPFFSIFIVEFIDNPSIIEWPTVEDGNLDYFSLFINKETPGPDSEAIRVGRVLDFIGNQVRFIRDVNNCVII